MPNQNSVLELAKKREVGQHPTPARPLAILYSVFCPELGDYNFPLTDDLQVLLLRIFNVFIGLFRGIWPLFSQLL